MPTALHPQAKFDPIPPDLDLQALVDRTANFSWVTRISLNQIRRIGAAGFERLLALHVIEGGKPLIIEGWNKILSESLFSVKWLEKTYDKKQENVRDLGNQTNIPMTTGHYLRSMRQLTNQWTPNNFRDERRQRLYLKDIDCPVEWHDHLRKIIPPSLFYMNENISENVDVNPRDDDIFGSAEPTPAVAGDLMSSLPEEMRAQNLMCYIGHEGTYTPAHREMCASLGQNIMVEASSGENGEKPGSSIWFMTETKDREVIREYFLSMLGHDIEIEKHFAQINAWKKANFPVYIAEQRAGDFILIPPLAPHQVWNRGTRTMKVAWNRTTVKTLGLALHEALPRARLVCRDEQYKNKAIIYYTLEKYYKELQGTEESAELGILGLGRELQNEPQYRQMADDFRSLFHLFTEVLIDEMFGYKQMDVEYIPFDSNITCSYCRSNIFNRFLTCKCCVRKLINGDEDTYDICMECYAMGRSCVCISGLQWCEQWHWADLVEKHEAWRAMVIKQDGFVDINYSPQPLEVARKKSGKRSVAQVCQEQLRRRPWNDITKPPEGNTPAESEPEVEVDDEGRVKKKPKPKRKAKKGDVHRCHVCCHKDNTYRLQFCTTCPEAYCYGVLWRAFDMMPQTAMEKENWQCPRCLGICNCGACRKAGLTTPYIPKNTLLGHDTRKVADDRSVESIVDFRIHNLNWLKAAGEENRSKDSKRMQRLKEQAEAEKAKGPQPVAIPAAQEDAPHDVESALQDAIIRDLGNEVGHGGSSGGLPADLQEGPIAITEDGEEAGSHVQVAEMSGIRSGEGDSQYPDPSAYPDPSVGGRMMGMGFYEQDDTPDKILFDAFQIPSADSLRKETEVSEFVKKQLRLAKRKARQEIDNDPDYYQPKSHHRKKPKTGNLDQLVNLDPALFSTFRADGSEGATPTQAEAPMDPTESSSSVAPTAENGEAQATQKHAQPAPAKPPLPIDPLNPVLRHAKPRQSYAEPEEPAETVDDYVRKREKPMEPRSDNEDTNRDPLDLAAEAVRALTQGGTVGDDATPSTVQQAAGKRRGRPPGRPSRASLPAPADESVAKQAKRRGRPPGATSRTRRHTASNVDYSEDIAMTDADDEERNVEEQLAADLDAELTRESGKLDPSQTAPPRRRGRPPGRRSLPVPEPQSGSNAAAAADFSMMSMAEKRAALGKKFKMRGRRGRKPKAKDSAEHTATSDAPAASQEPEPAEENAETAEESPEPEEGRPKRGRKELEDDDFEEAEADVTDSPPTATATATSPEKETSQAPVIPLRKSGLTVVRLASSDNEDSDSGSDFDDDDEGIPATKRYTAISSRGRGRGRARGRGRGGRMALRGHSG